MSSSNYNSEKAYLYGNTFIENPNFAYGQVPMPPSRPPYVPYGPPMHPYCEHCHGDKLNIIPPVDRTNCRNLSYYQNPPSIPNIGGCDISELDRNIASNIIEVQSKLRISLDLILYSVKADEDIKITLETGNKYKITYLSESGMTIITGILRYIDINTPLECTRYITDYNTSVNPHIIMDCSSEGNSDIRIIYIKSLRNVEEIKDEEPSEEPTENPDDVPSENPDGNTDTPVENPSENPTENPDNPSENPDDNTDTPVEDTSNQ